MTVNNILILFSRLLWLFPFIAYGYKWKCYKTNYLFCLRLPFVVAVVEGCSFIAEKNYPVAIIPIYNFFTLIELILVLEIVKKILLTKIPPQIIYLQFAILYSVAFYEIYFFGIKSSFIHTSFLSSIFELILAIYLLHDLLENSKEILVLQAPAFWIASSFLVYNLGTILLFLMNHTLNSKNHILYSLYYSWINTIFNFLFFLFLSVGILCLKPKNPSSSY